MIFKHASSGFHISAAMTVSLVIGASSVAAGPNNVAHSVEYDDAWRQMSMGKDVAEALAELTKASLEQTLRDQYQKNGYALKHMPDIQPQIGLLDFGNGYLANILVTMVYPAEQNIKDINTTFVFGIEENALHKVVCTGTTNPLANDQCRDKLETVFGSVMLNVK
jgi:hypothetical protein